MVKRMVEGIIVTSCEFLDICNVIKENSGQTEKNKIPSRKYARHSFYNSSLKQV